MFGFVSRKRLEAENAEVELLSALCRAKNLSINSYASQLILARRERNQAMTQYGEIAELLSVREDEITRLRAQIEAAKPLRDALGHFKSRKDAVMPEIAGRECSFVEREI